MLNQLRSALLMLVVLTVITGVLYPLAVTGIGQAIFPSQANGSLIEQDGIVVGSELIGQPFDDPRYFWGRLSATGPVPYNAAASSGSNYGPLHPSLVEAARGRMDVLRGADPANTQAVPVDLVTSSGSGLDPHISPAAAEFQVSRIAAARGMTEHRVRELVSASTASRTWGILGEARVNVLRLNLALDGR